MNVTFNLAGFVAVWFLQVQTFRPITVFAQCKDWLFSHIQKENADWSQNRNDVTEKMIDESQITEIQLFLGSCSFLLMFLSEDDFQTKEESRF